MVISLNLILDQKRELKNLEREINDNKREMQLWTDFRDYGQYHFNTQIRLLKKELDDMTENYNIIYSSIKRNLNSTLDNIKLNAEETIQKKNISAAQVLNIKYLTFSVTIKYITNFNRIEKIFE